MQNIPSELIDKYGTPLEVLQEIYDGDQLIAEIEYYRIFLANTDHICTKILEGVATSEDYADELYYRKVARHELGIINGGTGEVTESKPLDVRVIEVSNPINIMLGTELNMEQASEQMRKVIQMYAQTLTDEQAMEIATVYPAYAVGVFYKTGTFITYGTNDVCDPQLYKVAQDHTSQEDWTPDKTPALYTPIGLTDKGYPVWSKPSGAHDAYGIGDIVDYNGTLYKSLIDGNVYSPDEYPAGWEIYEEVQ